MLNRKKNNVKKGQSNITDFLIAVLMFIGVFIIFMTLSDRSQKDAFQASSSNELILKGVEITESFLGSKGIPPDWESNPSVVQSIGLVEDQNNLKLAKVIAFTSMDYNITKIKIGLPRNVNYLFEIRDLNGNILYRSGIKPDSFNKVFPFSRLAILNNTAVQLRLILYE
jgi:hypothetical protein